MANKVNKQLIEYKEGLVAFVDILGFSKLVSKNNSVNVARIIFDSIEKYQDFYNRTKKLKAQIAFFSDSIVITVDDGRVEDLLFPIWMMEQTLLTETGLLFRGAITKGLYYHEGSIAYGPAIVDAYNMEKEAKYSRIIIDDKLINSINNIQYIFMRDLDGRYCFNPYSIGIFGESESITRASKEEIFTSIKESRQRLIKSIKKNINREYAEKYTWRARPYNVVCKEVLDVFTALEIEYSKEEEEQLEKLQISLSEIKDIQMKKRNKKRGEK